MSDQDDHRPSPPLQDNRSSVCRVFCYLKSSRIFKALVIAGVTLGTAYYVYLKLRLMYKTYRNTEHLLTTIKRLHGIIEVLIQRLGTQQQAIVGLLQLLDTKLESQDKNTKELIQKNIERVQQLTDQTVKSVQEMMKQRGSESLQKTVGGAVVWSVKSVLTGYLGKYMWPLKFIL